MIKEAIVKIVNKEDLTYKEAYDVMNEIMNGETSPTQNAAFLAALSTKSARAETTDEIAGCAAAMREHTLKVETDMELFEIDRKKSARINVVMIILLSLPCALVYNVLSGFEPLGAGSSVLDLEDFLVSNNLLPIGSMIYLLFCCVSKKYGWGYDHFLEEANQGRGVRFPAQFRLYFKYVLPVIVLIIFIMGYWDKFKPFIVAALGA